MWKYEGNKCLSCQKEFVNNDDIVVCPECGTPYHRSCYIKEGKCINDTLHENKESWKPDKQEKKDNKTYSDSDIIKCKKCEEENPKDGLFCKKCGFPLTLFNNNPQSDNDNNQNFNNGFSNLFSEYTVKLDKDSEIDGVKLGDFSKYIGINKFILLNTFIRFGKFGGKTSLNFGAFLFPFYFFYRKMNKIGILYMFFHILFVIPTLIKFASDGSFPINFSTCININSNSFIMLEKISNAVFMALHCLAGLFANYLYYQKSKKDIKKIRNEEDLSNEVAEQKIAEKGGVSLLSMIMSVLVYSLLSITILLVINRIC